MKCMSIDKIHNFPFPTPPSVDSIERALKTLTHLGALLKSEGLDSKSNTVIKHKVSQLGVELSHFPIAPRYAKMLLLSKKDDLLGYTIAIVSGLSVQHSPFIEKLEENEEELYEKIAWSEQELEEEKKRKLKENIVFQKFSLILIYY